MPTEKSYLKAAVAFLVAGFLSIHLVFDFYDIVLEPEIFTLFFTFDVLAILVGLAFAKGPQQYVEMMFDEDHRVKTIALLGSMVLSTFVGVILGSYILSIIGCFIQLFVVS